VLLSTTPRSGTWGRSRAVLLSMNHEAVHEEGRGRRQYDVEMAEQWGVSAFVREGRGEIHSSTWRIWGEPLPPLAQVCGDQSCTVNSGSGSVDKGRLGISLFCSEDCRLCWEILKFEWSIGIGNQ
jgi:hypothetical protein